MTQQGDDITQMLRASVSGDQADAERLMLAIYDDLKRIAASQLRQERHNHTLSPTALVNEAYLRLVRQDHEQWNDRLHFFSIAARIIRRVLVDHARERHAQKRGGTSKPISIEHYDPAAPQSNVDLIALDDALAGLASISERQSRVVELRYFGGLTVPEIAAALDVSERTVDREWQAARAWLLHRLTAGERESDGRAQ